MAHECKNATASGFLLLSHTLVPALIYLSFMFSSSFLSLCNVVELLSVAEMFGEGSI